MNIVTNLKSQLKLVPGVQEMVERRRVKKKFITEIRLLQGRNLSKSAHPSIIHFSLNKSATTYVKHLLKICCEEQGMTTVRMHDYAFASKFPYFDRLSIEELQQYQHVFKPTGYLYTAFGGLVQGINNLDQYRVVLMTRDPRDILVSAYYSISYSHEEPTSFSSKNEEFYGVRSQARQQTIDEYVLNSWEKINEILQTYRDRLLEKYPHVYLTRYEDMVDDFENWFINLLEACQLDISEALKDQIIQKHYASRPKVEDKQAHVRKGVSGDYKNKLKDETISFLDEKLADMLAYYQYEQTQIER